MVQYYQADPQNGHKPLQLALIVGAQISTNLTSDQDAATFGLVVWKTLDADTKNKVQKAAKENPPNSTSIADMLYTPIRDILNKGPYYVSTPILDTFTSMKAPEVTEWVLNIQK